MSLTYNYQDIQTICTGATVLASGGGGSYQVGTSIVDKGVSQSAEFTVLAMDEVSPTDWYCVSCDIGEPSQLIGHPHIHAPGNALAALEENMKTTTFSGLLPVEIGAVSSVIPFVVAGQRSLPVVDADGAGRAVPTLPLLTFGGYGLPISPSCLASNGNPQYVDQYFPDLPLSEAEAAFVKVFMPAPYDGIAGLACWPLQGSSLQTAGGLPVAVGGTYADCHAVGGIFAAGGDVVQNIVDYLNCSAGRFCLPIFQGNVTAMTQGTGPQDLGTITITNGEEATLTISYQNENMLAYLSSYSTTEPYIMGPDSICYVPSGSTVFDNSDLYVLVTNGEQPAVTVLGIDPSPVVSQSATLMAQWQGALANIAYDGPYCQPWKSNSK